MTIECGLLGAYLIPHAQAAHCHKQKTPSLATGGRLFKCLAVSYFTSPIRGLRPCGAGLRPFKIAPGNFGTWVLFRKRRVIHGLAQRDFVCLTSMLPGSSASMASTVVAPGSFVKTSRR